MLYQSLVFFRLFDQRRPLAFVGPARLCRSDSKAACNAANNAYLASSSGDLRKWRRFTRPTAGRALGVAAGRDTLSVLRVVHETRRQTGRHTHERTQHRRRGALPGEVFVRLRASGDATKGYWTKIAGKVGGEWKILNLTYNFTWPPVGPRHAASFIPRKRLRDAKL